MNVMSELSVEVFSTCPSSGAVEPSSYRSKVIEAARWSERAGCQGMLIYTDNSLVDPWLIASLVIQHTSWLQPLIAVQPVYMHPYTVAKMITTLAHLYGRRVCLNMVAGGFTNDLLALNDATPHDQRYDRLNEYTIIIQQLLAGGSVSVRGQFYCVDKLRLTPALSPMLFPRVFVSGSSEAGLASARLLKATAIMYPKPVSEYEATPLDPTLRIGLRVGIIARQTEPEAWALAHRRFPPDRKGQVTHKLAMKRSDSVWHHQLSQLGRQAAEAHSPYWLVPFENYKTFCPYLVGSYQRVAEEIARYIAVGYRTFILDIPVDEQDLHDAGVVFRWAAALTAGAPASATHGVTELGQLV